MNKGPDPQNTAVPREQSQWPGTASSPPPWPDSSCRWLVVWTSRPCRAVSPSPPASPSPSTIKHLHLVIHRYWSWRTCLFWNQWQLNNVTKITSHSCYKIAFYFIFNAHYSSLFIRTLLLKGIVLVYFIETVCLIKLFIRLGDKLTFCTSHSFKMYTSMLVLV